MSGEVVALPGAVVHSDRKQAFLDLVGRVFDDFLTLGEGEPDGIVVVLGGVGGRIVPYHLALGDSQGRADAMLARAAIACMTRSGGIA